MPKKIDNDLRLELRAMVDFNEFDQPRVSVNKGPGDTAASPKVPFEIPILGTNARFVIECTWCTGREKLTFGYASIIGVLRRTGLIQQRLRGKSQPCAE